MLAVTDGERKGRAGTGRPPGKAQGVGQITLDGTDPGLKRGTSATRRPATCIPSEIKTGMRKPIQLNHLLAKGGEKWKGVARVAWKFVDFKQNRGT